MKPSALLKTISIIFIILSASNASNLQNSSSSETTSNPPQTIPQTTPNFMSNQSQTTPYSLYLDFLQRLATVAETLENQPRE